MQSFYGFRSHDCNWILTLHLFLLSLPYSKQSVISYQQLLLAVLFRTMRVALSDLYNKHKQIRKARALVSLLGSICSTKSFLRLIVLKEFKGDISSGKATIHRNYAMVKQVQQLYSQNVHLCYASWRSIRNKVILANTQEPTYRNSLSATLFFFLIRRCLT